MTPQAALPSKRVTKMQRMVCANAAVGSGQIVFFEQSPVHCANTFDLHHAFSIARTQIYCTRHQADLLQQYAQAFCVPPSDQGTKPEYNSCGSITTVAAGGISAKNRISHTAHIARGIKWIRPRDGEMGQQITAS